MQGIAALPTDMAPMDGAQEGPAIGSLTSQEAATLGRLLTKVSENEIEQLRELSSDLKEFTRPELQDFLGGVEYIMNNAGNYKQSVRNLITRGIVEPGDLPSEYIPTFYSILRQMILTAMQEEQATDEQQMPEQLAKGGLVGMAKKVKAAGRHGDTMLAHITPREAAALKAMGGAGTINPATGLPEFKSFWSKVGSFLKKAAPVILPVALSFIPGIGPAIGGAIGLTGAAAATAGSTILGAVGAGVGGLIAGQKPAQALLSAALGGVGGFAMSQLAPGGISGLLSGGATGAEAAGAAEAAASGIGPGSGLEGAADVVRGTGMAAPAGSVRPDIPLPLSRADVMSGAVSAPVSQAAIAGDTAGVSGGLGNLFSGGIGNALKNPWVAAGLAGAAGLAFGGAGKQGSAPSPQLVKGPSGAELLQQQPEKYGFNISNFTPQQTSVNIVPTLSPAFSSGYTGQLPGYYGIKYAKTGGHIEGPGTGTSDDVPALLSDGEFVLTAKAVRGAGNGDRMKGAKRLYKLMNELERRS